MTFKSITYNKKTVYFDKNIYEVLLHYEKAKKTGWDLIYAVDGVEGVGKTTFAVTCGFLHTKGNISNKNIIFTADQLIENCIEAKKGDTIIVDEAVLLLLSSENDNMAIAIARMLATIRSKRLTIIMVAPSYFDLKQYVAVRRTKFLIHLTTPDFMKRGFFNFYSYKIKNKMYRKAKQTGLYYERPSFDGKIKIDKKSIDSMIDWNQYEIDKQEAIKNITKKDKTSLDERNKMIYLYLELYRKDGKLYEGATEISKTIGLDENSINHIYYLQKKKAGG